MSKLQRCKQQGHQQDDLNHMNEDKTDITSNNDEKMTFMSETATDVNQYLERKQQQQTTTT